MDLSSACASGDWRAVELQLAHVLLYRRLHNCYKSLAECCCWELPLATTCLPLYSCARGGLFDIVLTPKFKHARDTFRTYCATAEPTGNAFKAQSPCSLAAVRPGQHQCISTTCAHSTTLSQRIAVPLNCRRRRM